MSKRKRKSGLPSADARLWVCVGCGNTQWCARKINPNALAGFKCWKCKGRKWT